MRVGMIGVAAAAVIAAVPAQAAVIVQIDAFASGTVTTTRGPCGEKPFCTEVTQLSDTFRFEQSVDLAIGQSIRFTSGANGNAGVRGGTITRTGAGTYSGTDFQFTRSVQLNNGGSTTLLTASTFSVRQIIPAPVPEPATWAMMILGFGAIGYAMRRKTVLRFV